MSFIRNIVAMSLGYLAIRTVQKMLANAQAQQERVKAKAQNTAGRIPTLKMDPITGVYRPEA